MIDISPNPDFNKAVLKAIYEDKEPLTKERSYEIISGMFGVMFSSIKYGVLNDHITNALDHDEFVSHFFMKVAPEIFVTRNYIVQMITDIKGIKDPVEHIEEITNIAKSVRCGYHFLNLLKEIAPRLTGEGQTERMFEVINKFEGKKATLETIITCSNYMSQGDLMKFLVRKNTGKDISTEELDANRATMGNESVITLKMDDKESHGETSITLQGMSKEELKNLDNDQINDLLDENKNN